MENHTTGSNAIRYPDKDTKVNGNTQGFPGLMDAIQQEVQQTSAATVQQLQNVFIPTWGNKPEEVPAILTLGGTPVLTYQNTSSIIALPGVGKSSIGESIAASILNPAADTLGFAVAKDCKGILFIDNERTTNDVWNSFYRMCKRAGLAPGSATDRVKLAGLRSVTRAEQRKKVIELLLEEGTYSLVIIDGAGDLVEDVNDLPQAIDCRIWLRDMTVKHGASIITTLHPNPGVNASKPRGHLGSEVCRESECVLLAKKVDEATRIITTEFENGKNRNSAPITTAYKWSDDAGMFVTADAAAIAGSGSTRANSAKTKAELLALKVLPAPKALTHSDLIATIMDEAHCSESTAKRRVKEMEQFNFIKKHDDGHYRPT